MTEFPSIERFEDLLRANRPSPRPRDALRWGDLDRQLRKAMSRILGGGSLRAIAPEIVRDLRQLGLIEVDRQSAKLTPTGWELLRSSREWLRAAAEPSARRGQEKRP